MEHAKIVLCFSWKIRIDDRGSWTLNTVKKSFDVYKKQFGCPAFSRLTEKKKRKTKQNNIV